MAVRTTFVAGLLVAFCITVCQHAVAQRIDHPVLGEELVAMLEEAEAHSSSSSIPRDSMATVLGRRLVEIVDDHGWPTERSVGLEATSAAYTLFRHHVSMTAQERLLPVAQRYFSQKGSWRVALTLADIVRLRAGKAQLYGTQVCQSEGEVRALAVPDTAAVNVRRKNAGLRPLEEYLRGLNRLCPCQSLTACP